MKERKDFSNFISSLSQLWNSQEFKSVLNNVKTELLASAIPIEEWENRTETVEGPGIYCFWYQGEKLMLKDFRLKYLKGSEGLSVSKPTQKWYETKKSPLVIGKGEVEAYSFYLGKRESVLNRISQHIGTIYSSSSTYGMHLNRNHQLSGKLYVGFWMLPFKKEKRFDKYIIQQVLTFIETELRKELAPWVGKQ